jgi:Spy/CpxP family protein refolding chaperone
MKFSKWIVALTVVLALTIAGIAFAQAGHEGGFRGHGGHGGPGFGFGPGMHFEQLAARLNLTAEKQHMEENRGQGQASVDAHDALAKELFKDQPNQAEIQKQLTVLQQDQARRMSEWVATAQEMNKVLTPDQRAEAQKIIDEQRTARANMREKMKERHQQREQKKDSSPQSAPPS